MEKPLPEDAKAVLQFWLEEITPKQWWQKDAAFDSVIRERFVISLVAARQGELWHWRQHPEGRLAEIIVLDQFSRNIYRDSAEAFAQDGIALVLAQEAVSLGTLTKLTPQQRPFLLMPYMHSESARIHEQAAILFNQPDMEDSYRFELRHKAIIDRFGRYPHRNSVLGRQSTPEEWAFLQEPGSSF